MIKTGDRNFWIAQIVGWSLIAGSNLMVQIIAGFPIKMLLSNSLTPLVVGFVLTTAYRYIIKELDWLNWKLGKTLFFIIASTLILASVFMSTVFIIFELIYGSNGFKLASFLGNMVIFTLVILAWNLIYFSIHYFNNWNQSQVEKWKLAAEVKDAQLGSLRSQIKPHFIFNSINNIRSLILEDPEKARDMLLNFSDLFRYTLKNTEQSKVTLKKELEIIYQYLELLSIQYEDKLKYSFEIEEGLEEIEIPPMMLQFLVENGVKHGISQFKDGGSLLVEINQSGANLNINVRNTGKLGKAYNLGDQLGVGLENIRKRLELIYDGKANLSLKELGNEVLASIKIPLS